MHICFITTGDIKSIATAKRALGLAEPLVEMGWEVSIIMEDSEENRKRVAMECKSNKVRVFYFPSCNAVQEIRTKNRIIKEIEPDCIYLCAFVFRNLVRTYKRKTIKLVEHSELLSAFRTGVKKIVAHVLELFSVIYADGLLYASKYLQHYYENLILNKILNKPGLYFPYAYNENVCINRNMSFINSYKRKMGVNSDEFVFVFLGSITVIFGAYLMLNAVKEILNKGKYRVKLFLLGEGKEYKQLKEYVFSDSILKKSVIMPGYVPEEDISLYFSIADSFILPMNDTIQDWARCPSKLYMYLPYNKPVITCKIGEPYEVLKDSGIYYECGNSDECLELLHSAISGNGIKYVEKALPSIIKAIERVCQGNYKVKVDPFIHTWKQRAIDLNNWLKDTMFVN